MPGGEHKDFTFKAWPLDDCGPLRWGLRRLFPAAGYQVGGAKQKLCALVKEQGGHNNEWMDRAGLVPMSQHFGKPLKHHASGVTVDHDVEAEYWLPTAAMVGWCVSLVEQRREIKHKRRAKIILKLVLAKATRAELDAQPRTPMHSSLPKRSAGPMINGHCACIQIFFSLQAAPVPLNDLLRCLTAAYENSAECASIDHHSGPC